MKTTMSKVELAKAFDCTPRWIERLVEAGMPKAGKGKFDVLESGEWYVRYLQRAIKKRNGTREVAVALSRDRLRLIKSQADQVEWQTEKLRSEFLPRSALVAAKEDMAAVVRVRFGDSFVERVAPLVFGLNRTQIAAVLDREIRAELRALAQAPPSREWKQDE
jgi:phage terminase Nu1 subunit (DNA packaging protein)